MLYSDLFAVTYQEIVKCRELLEIAVCSADCSQQPVPLCSTPPQNTPENTRRERPFTTYAKYNYDWSIKTTHVHYG